MTFRLLNIVVVTFAIAGVSACGQRSSSMIPAAEKVVKARLGGGDGITFAGEPLEDRQAICGEVDGGLVGPETFVARIYTASDGSRLIGEVSMTPRGNLGAIAADWNKLCGGKIKIGIAPQSSATSGSIPPAAAQQRVSLAAPVTSAPTGAAAYEGSFNDADGDLKVRPLEGAERHFSISAASADCVAEVEGTARVTTHPGGDETLSFTSPDPSLPCQLTIEIHDRTATVAEGTDTGGAVACLYHGSACGFDTIKPLTRVR